MGKLMEDKSYLFLSKIYAGSSWYWLSPVIRVTLLPPPGPGREGGNLGHLHKGKFMPCF